MVPWTQESRCSAVSRHVSHLSLCPGLKGGQHHSVLQAHALPGGLLDLTCSGREAASVLILCSLGLRDTNLGKAVHAEQAGPSRRG